MDKYRDICMKSFGNELGQLAQEIRDVPGTKSLDFIPHTDVPVGTTVTYEQIVCTYRLQKIEKHRTGLIVGGNLFICLYNVRTPTTDMMSQKVLSNSVISTPGARFITLYLKNFYLKTPLPQTRYTKMKIYILPNEIIKK